MRDLEHSVWLDNQNSWGYATHTGSNSSGIKVTRLWFMAHKVMLLQLINYQNINDLGNVHTWWA
jgi:hypothetical protein